MTDNISDYEKARLDWEARGIAHHGLVYALDPPFNRHWGDAVTGQMVRALEHLLSSPDAQAEAPNRVQAAVLDAETGEVVEARFSADRESLARWAEC